MTDSVEATVLDRLEADADLDEDVKHYVAAAIDGSLGLELHGDGRTRGTASADASSEARLTFLQRVSVAGFRGVGPIANLDVVPGPGLTLVTGANGTGKSSFAEGLEFLLTGNVHRWHGKSIEWRQGWRNVHTEAPPVLEATFAGDGEPGAVVVSRRWHSTSVALEDHTLDGLETLAWERACETHRPFLSYAQLSAFLERGPSARYDAIAAGLGLDRLSDARNWLERQRTADQRAHANAQAQLVELLKRLEERAPEDERADAARAALAEEPWNLDVIPRLLEGEITSSVITQARKSRAPKSDIEKLMDDHYVLLPNLPRAITDHVVDLDPTTDRPIALLNNLKEVDFVCADEIESFCRELGDVRHKVQGFKGGNQLRSARLARALLAALSVHEHEGTQACPVCKSGTIDDLWANKASECVQGLFEEIKQVGEIVKEMHDLLSACEEFTVDVGISHEDLDNARSLGIDTSELQDALNWWFNAIYDEPNLYTALGEDPKSDAVDIDSQRPEDPLGGFSPTLTDEGLQEVAGRLFERGATVRRLLGPLRESASAELARREELWIPLHLELRRWLPVGRLGKEAGERIGTIRSAEILLDSVEQEISEKRLQPIEARAQRYWGWVGQGSSVSLDGFRLSGRASARELELSASIEGARRAVPASMSQGESNALSLCLFMARALQRESPFGFLVLDDVVQAMDATKVEGLARLLGEAGHRRQILVFTHDERLQAALRRLNIDYRQLTVTRRPDSQVDFRTVDAPVQRWLGDARSVLKTRNVSDETKRRVIPGYCRQALEAACVEAVWHRRLKIGRDSAATQRDLGRAPTLLAKVALVMLDDSSGDHRAIRSAVYRQFGIAARSVVDACNRGAHGRWDGGMDTLISRTEWLANHIRRFGKR